MNNRPFDPTKPVQTRDGRKARILCTDSGLPNYPIVALVEGQGIPNTFSMGGSFIASDSSPDFRDLVNLPETVSESWHVNVYNFGGGDVRFSEHSTRRQADQEAANFHCPRFACVPITITATEGEGL